MVTLLAAALTPVAACAGLARRGQSRRPSTPAAREAIAGTLLEHTARGERARISRELHDVVAHHISMIAVQAETARLTAPDLPAARAQRLSAIGDTARAALTEMRRLLGVLREDTGEVAADRQPQPGLRQLNGLLDDARDATGAGTRLIVSGVPVSLDPGRGAGRLPDHPGGADQHPPARARRRGRRGAAVQRDGAAAADPRQRPGAAGRHRRGSPAGMACWACASGPPPWAAS